MKAAARAAPAAKFLAWPVLAIGAAALVAAAFGFPLRAGWCGAGALAAALLGAAARRLGQGRASLADLLGGGLLLWAAWIAAVGTLSSTPAWRALGTALAWAPVAYLLLLALAALARVQTPGAEAVRGALRWAAATWRSDRPPAPGLTGSAGWRRAGRQGGLPDLRLGRGLAVGARPVVWSGGSGDRYRHAILFGPPGTGKTSRILAPCIMQDLRAMASGRRMGLTVIEPKGDLAAAVAAAARELGLPAVHIDPTRGSSDSFNPLVGPPLEVAESIRAVLRAMFGRQEAFFSLVQEETARNTVLLLKRLAGDQLTMAEVLSNLQNPAKLRANVQRYVGAGGDQPLIEFFVSEVLSEAMADKLHQFAAGLRLQLVDLVVNRKVRRVLEGGSSIDLDAHLREGGRVLAIGTGMGELSGRLGQLFGQLAVMSLQNAIFRRPAPEAGRVAHALYIDEAPEFINPEFGRLLAMARGYRTSIFLALQNRQQLAERGGREFAETVLTNAQTRIIFGGLVADDAKWFASQFGRDQRVERSHTYQREGLWLRPRAEQRRTEWRERFDYTQLMELPTDQAAAQVLSGGRLQAPVLMATARVIWPRGVEQSLRQPAGAPDAEEHLPPIGLAGPAEIAAAVAQGVAGPGADGGELRTRPRPMRRGRSASVKPARRPRTRPVSCSGARCPRRRKGSRGSRRPGSACSGRCRGRGMRQRRGRSGKGWPLFLGTRESEKGCGCRWQGSPRTRRRGAWTVGLGARPWPTCKASAMRSRRRMRRPCPGSAAAVAARPRMPQRSPKGPRRQPTLLQRGRCLTRPTLRTRALPWMAMALTLRKLRPLPAAW